MSKARLGACMPASCTPARQFDARLAQLARRARAGRGSGRTPRGPVRSVHRAGAACRCHKVAAPPRPVQPPSRADRVGAPARSPTPPGSTGSRKGPWHNVPRGRGVFVEASSGSSLRVDEVGQALAHRGSAARGKVEQPQVPLRNGAWQTYAARASATPIKQQLQGLRARPRPSSLKRWARAPSTLFHSRNPTESGAAAMAQGATADADDRRPGGHHIGPVPGETDEGRYPIHGSIQQSIAHERRRRGALARRPT